MHRILHEESVRAEIMRGNLSEHLRFYERLMMEIPGRDMTFGKKEGEAIGIELVCLLRTYQRGNR